MQEQYIKVNLVPAHFRRTIAVVRSAGILVFSLAVGWLCFVGLGEGFANWPSAILYSSIVLAVASLGLLPGLLYDRISQSTVLLSSNKLFVLDKRGRCWRCVEYSSISKITSEDVPGFFYGKDKCECVNKYICIYIDGQETIPEVSYAKLFRHNGFLLFSFQQRAMDYILDNCAGTRG